MSDADIHMEKRIYSSGGNDWVTLRQIAYKPKNILGKGSDGSTVYRGKFGHIQAAIKEVDKTSLKWMNADVEVLIRCHGHPNVTRHYAKEEKGRFCYLALELCQGNLKEYILSEKKFNGEKPVAMDLLKQMTKGLQYLHENKLVHGGLQPDNILISQPDDSNKIRAVISDFATNNRDHTGNRLIPRDKSGFASYEVLELEIYNEATDVFSLGCLYYYVITKGKQIFQNGQKSVDRQPVITLLNQNENALLKDCIELMIQRNPTARPSCAEILQGPLYWDSAQTLQYIESVTDWLVSGILHPNISKQLESNKDDVIQCNWRHALTPELRDLLNEDYQFGQKYNYNSVVDLLRMIRNKSRHYNDVPYNVRRDFQSFPEGYVKYFTSRFPNLIFHVFLPFRSFTVDANLNIRNHKECDCHGISFATDKENSKVADTIEIETFKSTVSQTQLNKYPSSLSNEGNTEVRADVNVAVISTVTDEEQTTGKYVGGMTKQWMKRFGHLDVEGHTKHDQDQIDHLITNGSMSYYTNLNNPIHNLDSEQDCNSHVRHVLQQSVSTAESDVDGCNDEMHYNGDTNSLLTPKKTNPTIDNWNGTDISIPNPYESRNVNVAWTPTSQNVKLISTERQHNYSSTDNRKQDDGIIESQQSRMSYRSQVSEEERKQKLTVRRSRSRLTSDDLGETLKYFCNSQTRVDQHGQQASNENSLAKSSGMLYLKPVTNNMVDMLTPKEKQQPFERTQSVDDLRRISTKTDLENNNENKVVELNDDTVEYFLNVVEPLDATIPADVRVDEPVLLVPCGAPNPGVPQDEHVLLVPMGSPKSGVSQDEHVLLVPCGAPKSDVSQEEDFLLVPKESPNPGFSQEEPVLLVPRGNQFPVDKIPTTHKSQTMKVPDIRTNFCLLKDSLKHHGQVGEEHVKNKADKINQSVHRTSSDASTYQYAKLPAKFTPDISEVLLKNQ